MNSNSKKKRAILVVDQDFRYQLLNQLTLQSQYDVVVVGTIADAVALRPLSRFELFIFGVEASGPNSLEACEQAQRLPEVKDIPVILTTENPGDFAGRFSFDLHEEHLLKPYDPFELSARVRSRVGKSKSENLEEILRSGGLELNLTQRRVFWTREKPCEIFLTAIEFKILQIYDRRMF